MAKTKKQRHRNDLAAAVGIDGDEFPAAITVELWHRRPKGKRTLVGSRRYELAADLSEATAVAETPAVNAAADVTSYGVEGVPALRPAAPTKRARQPRPATPPSA